ncbi:MAG: IS256 family transposase [Deltaproteobacteria bacterium]|nr:IS256 family transposase [Deltaproteobacteria bacterium]
MKKIKRIHENGQADMAPEMRQFARDTIEQMVRAQAVAYVAAIMEEEVTALCGRPFARKLSAKLNHRGGSDTGSVVLSGSRVQVKKPRVRNADGELQLQSYAALSNTDNLGDMIFKMILAGVSTRSYDNVIEKYEHDLGVSKSTASRQFQKNSRESLNEINTRKFPDSEFWALMIDGTYMGGEVIVVALGVDRSGNKHFLGISQGSTENAEVVKSLLGSIASRDIRFTERVIAVLDGSKALKKGVISHFGKEHVAIQRCLIHKERNVIARLSKKHHTEFNTQVRQAYNSNDYDEAKKEFNSVISWLADINHNAAESMKEGLEEILTLHRLNMPPQLRKSLYTTNLIESGFSNPRFKMNRVKRWRKDTDMIKRWAGATLLEQEKTFRAINGCSHIEEFLDKLFLIDKDKIMLANFEAA